MTCTLWAIASVRMMIGAPDVPAFRMTPSQPATPRVATTVRTTETSATTVHRTDRTETPTISRISSTMIGNRVAMSCCGTSEKAMLNMTLPVR